MFHIVDDNVIGGRNTAKIIKLFDSRSMVFTSAIEYLEYVKSPDYQRPMAIFTDIFMHRMNGYEMIEALLAIYPDQKFVVISGRPDLNHPYKDKACFYLNKPFYIRDVEMIINEVRNCEKTGPSPEAECAFSCSHEEFSLGDWRCPHSAKP
jgi:FixJ family two-component response regulator